MYKMKKRIVQLEEELEYVPFTGKKYLEAQQFFENKEFMNEMYH